MAMIPRVSVPFSAFLMLLIDCSVAISACGNGGQWKKALALLNLMRDKGLPVNKITYNAAITALSKASRNNAKRMTENKRERIDPAETEGLWSRALILLKQMKDDGIEPDGFCYSSAISCCGAEGRWEEALILMKVMKRGGPLTRPNKIAYTAAISTYYNFFLVLKDGVKTYSFVASIVYRCMWESG
jgi:pentatricopeptide repeat domain-containing protein 1